MVEASHSRAAELALQWLVEQAVEPSLSNVAAALAAVRVAVPNSQLPLVVSLVRNRLVGYGELQPLLEPGITDVLVNAADSVWTDSDSGLRRADTCFADEAQVRRLALRLASLAGRRLDESQPFVDALLPDGVRLQAALPPVAVAGTCLSLRIPSSRTVPMARWLGDEATRQRMAGVLAGSESFVISGSTGAGKTTLLRSLLQHWPSHRRVVCVEDVKELDLDLPNVVMLQGREANAEGVGAVPMSALVRHSLRMRPDAIVVGEVRGPEVVEWLLAISSGHPGSGSTVHAASARGALRRLLLLAELAGVPRSTALAVVADALSLVIHVRRAGSHRVIAEVARVSELLAGFDD